MCEWFGVVHVIPDVTSLQCVFAGTRHQVLTLRVLQSACQWGGPAEDRGGRELI